MLQWLSRLNDPSEANPAEVLSQRTRTLQMRTLETPEPTKREQTCVHYDSGHQTLLLHQLEIIKQ